MVGQFYRGLFGVKGMHVWNCQWHYHWQIQEFSIKGAPTLTKKKVGSAWVAKHGQMTCLCTNKGESPCFWKKKRRCILGAFFYCWERFKILFDCCVTFKLHLGCCVVFKMYLDCSITFKVHLDCSTRCILICS